MTTKKHKNGRANKLKACASNAKQDYLPPEIHDAKLPVPGSLATVGDIRAEMERIYKMVFRGEIMLADATRLAYYLDRMIQAIKTETELNTIAAAYAKAWGGVAIITDEEAIDGNTGF